MVECGERLEGDGGLMMEKPGVEVEDIDGESKDIFLGTLSFCIVLLYICRRG